MSNFSADKKIQNKTQTQNFSGLLVTALEPTSAASEAYRTLRTSLLYSQMDDPPKTIVVTSPGSGEGKSAVCANLGVVLAQAGKSTLLMDCDLRRPMLNKIFGLRNKPGLANAMAGESSLQDLCDEPVLNLKVLKAGVSPPDPAELLGSNRFIEFVANIEDQFDYVLIDSPPARLVSDPLILATQADGVLLVLDAQKTRKSEVRRTVRSLTGLGAVILGTVMNNAKEAQDQLY